VFTVARDRAGELIAELRQIGTVDGRSDVRVVPFVEPASVPIGRGGGRHPRRLPPARPGPAPQRPSPGWRAYSAYAYCMSDATTIRVPRRLRERIAERARQDHTTHAKVIEAALDQADRAAFWAKVRRTMTTSEARTELVAEAEALHNVDGLEAEDWSDHQDYPW
jgi:predicted transcriptional regulator